MIFDFLTEGTVKLNLGCGSSVLEDYINVDIRLLVGVDLVADVENLPLKDSSIDHILARDIFEHISFRKTLKTLCHWHDKLKNGGELLISTTSINHLLRLHQDAKNYEDLESVLAGLYGGHDYSGNFHYTVGILPLHTEYLRLAGFVDIEASEAITFYEGIEQQPCLKMRGIKKEIEGEREKFFSKWIVW